MFMDFPHWHCYFHTHFRRDWPSMHIETAGTAWSGLPDEEGPWEVLRGVFVCERNTMWRENYGNLCYFNAIIEYFQPCSYIFRKMVFNFFRWLFYEEALYFHHAFTDDLDVFQPCPMCCDPKSEVKAPPFETRPSWTSIRTDSRSQSSGRPNCLGLPIDPQTCICITRCFEWSPPTGML